MARVAMIGIRGSKACREIREGTGIPLYKGINKGRLKPDVLINYGLSGQKLERFLKKVASARSIPTINKYVGVSKYKAVKDAEKIGILVPESRLSLPRNAKLSHWIEKRVNSSKGYGIREARGRGNLPGKYYQKMISDRRFELRVHTFLWIPDSEWRINKRFGPRDQIAWNFNQGGHFSSVMYPNKHKVFAEAKEIATKVLKQRNMAFGAVDLIVDNDMKVYFIEVNSSPGFTDLNKGVYVNAFSKLKGLSKSSLVSLAR